MLKNTDEQQVIKKLVSWAKAKPDIRAVILTSSRAKPGATLDEFSDYDVIFVAKDIKPYRENESWLEEYGKVLVVYRDPVEIRFGYERFIDCTQYENGLKMDFTMWPVDLLTHVTQMEKLPNYIDDGYKVLLDKDGLTRGMKTPSCRAFVPKPPTEAEYHAFIEEFFYDIPYAAKQIRRGDIFALKLTVYYMRDVKLCRLLEWKIEIEHNWSLKSGYYGKGLQKYLTPSFLKKWDAIHFGSVAENNWESLFKIIRLFGKVAGEVGQRLGYAYPEDMDKRMLKYTKKVRNKELP
jgi:aminoglycoside 6-adenylyltransferase